MSLAACSRCCVSARASRLIDATLSSAAVDAERSIAAKISLRSSLRLLVRLCSTRLCSSRWEARKARAMAAGSSLPNIEGSSGTLARLVALTRCDSGGCIRCTRETACSSPLPPRTKKEAEGTERAGVPDSKGTTEREERRDAWRRRSRVHKTRKTGTMRRIGKTAS